MAREVATERRLHGPIIPTHKSKLVSQSAQDWQSQRVCATHSGGLPGQHCTRTIHIRAEMIILAVQHIQKQNTSPMKWQQNSI